VRKALRIPCHTIASNAGVDADDVVTRVMREQDHMGYDALHDRYVDMMQSGIIDPTKVCTRVLLKACPSVCLSVARWQRQMTDVSTLCRKCAAKFLPIYLLIVRWLSEFFQHQMQMGGSVAEWLECWTQAQKGLGSNCSRNAVR